MAIILYTIYLYQAKKYIPYTFQPGFLNVGSARNERTRILKFCVQIVVQRKKFLILDKIENSMFTENEELKFTNISETLYLSFLSFPPTLLV